MLPVLLSPFALDETFINDLINDTIRYEHYILLTVEYHMDEWNAMLRTCSKHFWGRTYTHIRIALLRVCISRTILKWEWDKLNRKCLFIFVSIYVLHRNSIRILYIETVCSKPILTQRSCEKKKTRHTPNKEPFRFCFAFGLLNHNCLVAT